MWLLPWFKVRCVWHLEFISLSYVHASGVCSSMSVLQFKSNLQLYAELPQYAALHLALDVCIVRIRVEAAFEMLPSVNNFSFKRPSPGITWLS